EPPVCGAFRYARKRSVSYSRDADGSGTEALKQPLRAMRNSGIPRSESYHRDTPSPVRALTPTASDALVSAEHASTFTNRGGSGILPAPAAACSSILLSRASSFAATTYVHGFRSMTTSRDTFSRSKRSGAGAYRIVVVPDSLTMLLSVDTQRSGCRAS